MALKCWGQWAAAGRWCPCARLLVGLCVPAVQGDATVMGMNELERVPVFSPSACISKIRIALGLEHMPTGGLNVICCL